MPKFETEIFFPYSAKQIHNMVADIEKYPEFLPNCDSLTVKKHQKTPEKDVFLAEMGVKFGIFSEKFDSNVVVKHLFHTIDVNIASGPIKRLDINWKFVESQNGNGCTAKFNIKIEMKSLPLKLALAAAFNIAVNDMTQSFVTRANHLYL